MNIYSFAFPVKVNYMVDESMLSIESIGDIERIEQIYDIDLSYIVEKCDYIDMNVDDDCDSFDDYYTMPIYDIFKDIISDNWNSIINKLNKEYKLKDLDEDVINKLFKVTKRDFEENVNDIDKPINFDVKLFSFDKNKSEFIINISTKDNLKNEEIEAIRMWLDNQTTNLWGEEFSKKDLSMNSNIDDIFIYIIPWSLKKEVRYIKNK